MPVGQVLEKVAEPVVAAEVHHARFGRLLDPDADNSRAYGAHNIREISRGGRINTNRLGKSQLARDYGLRGENARGAESQGTGQ
ncbi:hypothetical protein GCM10009077_34590 [Roseibium denhamense]